MSVDEMNDMNITEFNEKCSTIEEILKTYFNDKKLRILNMTCEPGSKTGDNYMSIVKRINVEFSIGNGRTHEKSLILKRPLADKARRELFRSNAAFENEISAYCHVVPALKRFSKNKLALPNSFYAGYDEEGYIIVMEDLGRKGFKLANRLEGFDFQHSSVLMRELAEFHAVSLAMKIIEPKLFSSLIKNVREVVFVPSAADFYSQQLEYSLNQAINCLSDLNEFDLELSILKNLNGSKLYDIMMDIATNSDDKWNVIIHGDLWTNNIMFQYGSNGEVNYANFIDLQAMRYSNFICDILVVLYSSTKYKLRMQHMDSLIDIYCDSLINTLREYMEENYSCELMILEKMYTSESIKKEMANKSLYGLGMSLWVMPAITFVPDVKELDSLMSSLNDSEKHDEILTSLKTKEYDMRVRDIIREFSQRGYFDSILKTQCACF